MIDDKTMHMILDQAEKEIPNPLRIKERKSFVFGAAFMWGFLSPDIEKLRSCNHPGCCCVCGHTKTCPEDGPSHIEGIAE